MCIHAVLQGVIASSAMLATLCLRDCICADLCVRDTLQVENVLYELDANNDHHVDFPEFLAKFHVSVCVCVCVCVWVWECDSVCAG